MQNQSTNDTNITSTDVIKPTLTDLQVMDQKILQLRKQAETSKADANDAVKDQFQTVEDQYKLLKAKVVRYYSITDHAKDEIKEGVNKSWEELKQAVDNVKSMMH